MEEHPSPGDRLYPGAHLVARVLERAREIQQISAPTFAEANRARFIQQKFIEEGLNDVSIDEIGNVYGRVPGRGQCLPLVLTAHTDTVFPGETDLSLTITDKTIHGPGIGDNSLGVAGLFGLLWALGIQPGVKDHPGDLWLVANVGEEGLGNLGGMRAVVDKFGNQVLAYLILEGMALGHIYNRALGVERYRLTARTAGGHSWVDYGKPSAIHELAALVTQLTSLPLPQRPRTTLNVGIISGGTSVNTIAAEAHLEVDLRSEGADALNHLAQQVQGLAHFAGNESVQVECELIGQRPSGKFPSHHPLVRLAQHSLEAQGIRPHLTIGSTDANIPLSLGLPAITIGLTRGGGAHTSDEFIQTTPLHHGLAHLVMLVEQIFSKLAY